MRMDRRSRSDNRSVSGDTRVVAVLFMIEIHTDTLREYSECRKDSVVLISESLSGENRKDNSLLKLVRQVV